jgi:hypothetical protein
MGRQQGQNDACELVPESETDYNIVSVGIRISFVREASGKATGFTGYQDSDFEAKKLD